MVRSLVFAWYKFIMGSREETVSFLIMGKTVMQKVHD